MSRPAEYGVDRRTPSLAIRVVIGAVLGAALGAWLGVRPWPHCAGFSNADLGRLGMLVIRALKTLAGPLVFFAIADSLLSANLSRKHAGRLVTIAIVNVAVAMAIGLTLLNTLRPGLRWHGRFGDLSMAASTEKSPGEMLAAAHQGSLRIIDNVDRYVPTSIVAPFAEGEMIGIVLLALLTGAALRVVRSRERAELSANADLPAGLVNTAYSALVQMLNWVLAAVPFAVFAILAQVVGIHGLAVFGVLRLFLFVILAGMALHTLVWYTGAAWLAGRRPPRVYLARGLDAILTALSVNSSLATMPVTLRCLQRMGVSEESARLGVCVGTNLNHDGITLYEAMTALFLAQAMGYVLTVPQQVTVVLASIMAGVGVAGIPEAGFVMLPLVLAAAGLPEIAIATWLPVILGVDWIIARCRSAANVMNEMMVATVLDRLAERDHPEPPAEPTLASPTPGRPLDAAPGA